VEASPGGDGAPTRSGGELALTVRQTQRIDRDNPAYAFRLPVVIKAGEPGTASFSSKIEYLSIDSRESTHRFALEAKPNDVVIDPNMNVAAPTRVKKPLAMLIEQLRDGSDDTGTVFAQMQAVEMLEESSEPAAGAALALVGMDQSRDALVRQAAADALSRRAARTIITAASGLTRLTGSNE
jgi:hypothetical protein